MKIFFRIIFIASLATALGCSTMKKLDTTGFSQKGYVIYYNNEEVATLSNIEYSYDGGKFVKEMTFKVKDHKHGGKVRNLIYYIHKQHKDWEIEIDYPLPPETDIPK